MWGGRAGEDAKRKLKSVGGGGRECHRNKLETRDWEGSWEDKG